MLTKAVESAKEAGATYHVGNLLSSDAFYGDETEVGNITLRDQVADFKCPLKTYSYCMQLLNGGAEEFRFHSIIIQEVVHEREETIKTIS